MTFFELTSILSLFTPAPLIAGVLIGIYYYRQLDEMHKNFIFYLVLMLAVEIVSRFLELKGNNNQIMLPVFSLVELIFFAYFYHRFLLKKFRGFFLILTGAGALYIIGEILFYFVFSSVSAQQFQPYCKVVDNLIVISLVLAFFNEKINLFKESKWDNFKFNIILLLFFTINLIFFLPFNFLVNESTGLKFYFWFANLLLTIAFYIFLIYRIWNYGRMRKNADLKIK